MGALLFLLYGFQILGENPSISLKLIGAFLVSIIMFALFVVAEKRATDPIILLSLFNNRTFVIQNVVAALVSGLIAVDVYIPMGCKGF